MNRRIVLSLLTLLALSGLACNFSVSTAKVSDATLSKDVNDKKEPVNPTSTFDPGDKIIHCVVKLAYAPGDTKVKARWIAANVEGSKPNDLIAEKDIDAGGTNNIVDFTLTSDSGFPPGNYKVDIFLNPKPDKESKPEKSLSFSVKSGSATSSSAKSPGSVRIESAHLSKDPNGESTATIFSA